MLSRDAAGAAPRHRAMLRAAYEVATAWSVVLAGVMVALAVSAGLDTQRGEILLVLAPSMAFNGLNPARVFFVVTFRTRLLVLIDVLITLIQVSASVGFAVAGLGPVAVAISVTVGSIVNNVVVSALAQRILQASDGSPYSRRTLLSRSAPLGVVAILTRVYLTIDLVLLGWLVSGPRLGQYAAAAKLLSVLGAVVGAVMMGALPALSRTSHRREELEELTSEIWHWLVIGPLPVFVALGLFAAPLLDLTLGHQYHRAAPLLQVLAIAGAVGVLSNLVGNLMIVFRKNRALILQNTLAIVVNVIGNLILVPKIGVVAAAWMTLVTELIVCVGSIFTLRHEISLHRAVLVSTRPALAVVAASAVAIALRGTPALAAVASAAAFLGLVSAFDAWPAAFRPSRWLSAG